MFNGLNATGANQLSWKWDSQRMNEPTTGHADDESEHSIYHILYADDDVAKRIIGIVMI